MAKKHRLFSAFGKEKAILAFEFGVVLSDVAHEHKIEMTKEIVLRAEKILETELGTQSLTDSAHTTSWFPFR